VYFSQGEEGQNTLLNGRLPGITAPMFRLALRSETIHPRNATVNLPRVETFPGAACLRRSAAIDAPRQISRVF